MYQGLVHLMNTMKQKYENRSCLLFGEKTYHYYFRIESYHSIFQAV